MNSEDYATKVLNKNYEPIWFYQVTSACFGFMVGVAFATVVLAWSN